MKIRGPLFAAAVAGLPAFAIVVSLGSMTAAQRADSPTADAVDLIDGYAAVAGEVLVTFNRTPDLARLRSEINSDADALVGDGRIWRARSRVHTVRALLALLRSKPEVRSAEPNYIVHALREPNDPRFSELWGLRNVGQSVGGIAGTPGADIKATAAWDVSTGSRTTVVGIVDTGIDYLHPDLAANVWTAPARFSVLVGGQTITCPAGTHGFNAITRICDPMDDHFHGTHVSGTIAAAGNNATGVAGVNWIGNLIGLKFLNSGGSGALGDAINAIEFAIQAKAAFPSGAANVRVLSNSWSGGPFSQALADEIVRAGQNDILFVAAAGNSASNNDETPAYPASYGSANVVAVAATDNQDALASFSNYGAQSVHLGAPGVRVLSTVPGGDYNTFSGTSMATPHVSGAAALLLSRCAMDTPTLKSLILDSVEPTAALAGKTITGGRLDVGQAMANCGTPGNQAPIVTLLDPAAPGSFTTPVVLTLRASASDPDGSVARVSFFDGGALVATRTAPPFEFVWSGLAVGAHAITAVATDNRGASTTSPSVILTVSPGSDSPAFGGTPATVPGLIEAENFNEGGSGLGYFDNSAGNAGGKYRDTDVDIETTQDTGGGYNVGWMRAGEWLAYWITVTSAGDYTVDARVASNVPGGTFHLEVDGQQAGPSLAVPATGGWQTWQTVSATGVPMPAGRHLLRVVIDSNGTTGYLGNLNAMRFRLPGTNTPPAVSLTAPASGATFMAPATIPLSATASDWDGTVSQVRFYAGATPIATDTTAPFTASWTNVPVGTYTLSAIATDDGGASAPSNLVSITVVEPPSPTPYGGTPSAVPGRIEAENFDEGGEGVAYHDTTSGNIGGKYRATDVDIESTVDAASAYSLGWITAGEYLKYTIAATTTALYALELRVATPQAGATLHLEVDGVDATGPIVVPATGGWQTWSSITKSDIAITAGPHVLRIAFDTNAGTGYVANFNYFRLTIPGATPPLSPFGGVAATIPGLVEIENFDEGVEGVAYHDLTAGNTGGRYRTTDVDIETAFDTGGGFNVGWASAGEWLKYTVSVAATADYTLEARVAWQQTGGTFHVEVDDVDVTGPMTVATTGGSQTWGSVTKSGVHLTAGAHVLRLSFDTNGSTAFTGNFNFLRFTTSAPNAPSTPFGGTPAAIPGTVQAENFDVGADGIAYHDLTTGNAGGQYRGTDVDIEATVGGYSVGWINAGEWLKYSVSVAATGTYTLDAHVSWPTAGGTFHVEIDGADVTGPLQVPATGGYQTWGSITKTGIALTAGPHVMRIVFDTNGPTGYVCNLNDVRWTQQ